MLLRTWKGILRFINFILRTSCTRGIPVFQLLQLS